MTVTPAQPEITSSRSSFALRLNVVALTALMALLVDLFSTRWALATLSPGVPTSFGPFTLLLQGNAGNVTNESPVAPPTLFLEHGVLILLALLLVVRASRLAWAGAGLILGGALGNLIAVLMPSHQVPDFLVVGPLSANLADVTIVLGVVVTVLSFYRPLVLLFRRTVLAPPSSPTNPEQAAPR